MSGDVRVDFKLSNPKLMAAIESAGGVCAFCDQSDVSYQLVSKLLRFELSPWTLLPGNKAAKRPAVIALKRSAKRLCEVLGLEAEELFPARLYPEPGSQRVPVGGSFVIDSARLISLRDAPKRNLIAEASQDSDVLREELRAKVAALLSTLTPREALVMRMRHGIDGDGEHTFEEIGCVMNVTQERVRQIELKATRKLRHPSRGKALRPFLERPLQMEE